MAASTRSEGSVATVHAGGKAHNGVRNRMHTFRPMVVSEPVSGNNSRATASPYTRRTMSVEV